MTSRKLDRWNMLVYARSIIQVANFLYSRNPFTFPQHEHLKQLFLDAHMIYCNMTSYGQHFSAPNLDYKTVTFVPHSHFYHHSSYPSTSSTPLLAFPQTPINTPIHHPQIGKIKLSFCSDRASSDVANSAMTTNFGNC
jgi:hypothetical protein